MKGFSSRLLAYLALVAYCGWDTHARAVQNPEEAGPHFEGDLILTASSLSGIIESSYRWINQTVHYEFEPEYPDHLKATFLLATHHISERTCIKFEELEGDSSIDYIYVIGTRSFSCYSYVGRQGGRQVISLPQACHSFGIFIHELLHSIGFHHEQSRTDRDSFVKVNWENVLPGKEKNFRKYEASYVSSFGVPYDYDSVLHYSETAFSKSPPLPTIEPIENGKKIGQRDGMSDGDVAKVNKMYGCS